MNPSWDDLVAGHACPLDAPRPDDSESMLLVRKLSVSSLYLDRNQTYRGHGVLVFDPRHVTRIDELSRQEWQAMADDIRASELAIYRAFQPDHINVVSLGNVVPHLHWHIIPRYRDDPRWREPIWESGDTKTVEVFLPRPECLELVARIIEQLDATDG